MKTYYLPNNFDDFFGSATPVCVDREEIMRLARDWDCPNLMDSMCEAGDDDIEKYGVYDSPIPSTIPIYWDAHDLRHSGYAEYIHGHNASISFNGYERNIMFDCVSADDCDSGITLDDIWSDLLSQRNELGELDVTNIDLR